MFMPGPKEMSQVLAVTDELRIHREAVRIPLETAPGGAVSLEKDRLVVVLPEDGDLTGFLEALPGRIEALPGRAGLRVAED